AGDLAFQTGSRYEIEVDPDSSDSDKIEVGGKAKLAGSVIHIGLHGDYRNKSTYNILTANNGIQGQFDDVASNFAFLKPILEYDANNVDLTLLRNDVRFADYAITTNQKSTANGRASLPDHSSLLQKVELLPTNTSPELFDGLSGEIHAGLISALDQNSAITRSFALPHLRNNLSSGYRPGTLESLPLWAEVLASRQTFKGNDNAASFKQNISGIFVGGDFPISKGWRLGGALG